MAAGLGDMGGRWAMPQGESRLSACKQKPDLSLSADTVPGFEPAVRL